MKPIIPDQAEKLRQLAAKESAKGSTETAGVLEPPEVESGGSPQPEESAVPKIPADGKTVSVRQKSSFKNRKNGKRRSKRSARKAAASKQLLTENGKQPKTVEAESTVEQTEPVVLEKSSTDKKDELGQLATPIVTPLPIPKRIPVDTATQIVAITGGKGGVGKSNVASNLAIAMAQMKKRVLLLDADLSLANVDVLFGMTPRLNLSHVISGEKQLSDIAAEGPEGITIVPGGSGLEQLMNMADEEMARLFDAFAGIDPAPDYMLVDTAAGIHPNVLQFLVAADQTIVVTTPEPTAYTDAYALIKTCVRRVPDKTLGVLVNMAEDGREATDVTRLMLHMCRQFLNTSFNNLGFVPRDPAVLKAVRHQKPFLLGAPGCPASKAIRNIAATILQVESKDRKRSGLRKFFQRLLGQRPGKQAEAS